MKFYGNLKKIKITFPWENREKYPKGYGVGS